MDNVPLPTPPERTKPLPPLPSEVTKAYIIPIYDVIDGTMAEAVRRKVVQVIGQGGELVIFDVNTPGGMVSAVEDMMELVVRDLKNIRTVAFINSEALSAGAFFSLACDEIVFVTGGRMGAAAVIAGTGEDLPKTLRQKADSALRANLRTLCEAHGYNIPLAESMTDPDVEVWLVRHLRTDETRLVDRSEWITRVRALPDQKDVLHAEAEWEVVRVINPKGKLLTVTSSEALRYGFATTIVGDMDELLKQYHVTAKPARLEDTWSERLTSFLTSMPVTALLFTMVIFFGYIEVNTPGFGIFGTIALICLALLIGSRFMIGLAQWWEIVMLILGLVLLGVEIFVTPGFGVLGITGILLCLVALGAMFIPNAPDELPVPKPGLALEWFLNGVFTLGAGLTLGVIAAALVARFLPRSPMGTRLILAPVNLTVQDRPSSEAAAIRGIVIGTRGRVEALCRPAGRARFGDELVDVVAEGGFLPAGTRIEVIRNEGNRLVVRAICEEGGGQA